ncbi:hypothetical protein SAMN05216270_10115 [Glycomyces harbinensis]|uniref:Uncharacterized protein n=1 Tax=Glycomyces harbinensis TaxID=58114 RepID=A0A1G6QNF7_9ACTN|nr:hypothetical protein SAMN05216270_10115 [Glycomyces harbinensis]
MKVSGVAPVPPGLAESSGKDASAATRKPMLPLELSGALAERAATR